MVLRLRGGGKSDALIKLQRDRVKKLEGDVQKLKKAIVVMDVHQEENEKRLLSLTSKGTSKKKNKQLEDQIVEAQDMICVILRLLCFSYYSGFLSYQLS